MLKRIFRKEYQIEQLIYDYLGTLEQVRDNFLKALEACFTNGVLCENFEFYITQTHKNESKADDIREEINELMYGKALIPDSRGDIMALLLAVDKIPHLMEQILFTIQIQKIVAPGFLLNEIRSLLHRCVECCDLMSEQIHALFKKQAGIRDLVRRIDTNESHCDHQERRILKLIFDSGIDTSQKFQLKEIITLMGEIPDQADRVSKMINIINMKRRV